MSNAEDVSQRIRLLSQSLVPSSRVCSILESRSFVRFGSVAIAILQNIVQRKSTRLISPNRMSDVKVEESLSPKIPLEISNRKKTNRLNSLIELSDTLEPIILLCKFMSIEYELMNDRDEHFLLSFSHF